MRKKEIFFSVEHGENPYIGGSVLMRIKLANLVHTTSNILHNHIVHVRNINYDMALKVNSCLLDSEGPVLHALCQGLRTNQM